MTHMKTYRLSLEADENLSDIYDYTDIEYGTNQAVKYLSGFEDLFDKLVKNPEIGRIRPEIKRGLTSVVKESHVVFYRIMSDYLKIVRVLHTRKDLRNFEAQE